MSSFRMSAADRMRLEVVSADLPQVRGVNIAVRRFEHYCRKGYSVQDSVRYALAFARNMTEQRARRVSHDTGAEA